MSTLSPFKITAVNEGVAWEDNFCLQCTNGQQTLNSKKITVTKPLDCRYALKEKKEGTTDITLGYTSSPYWDKRPAREILFDVLSEDCPIEKCILTDCTSDTSPYKGNEVVLEEDDQIVMSKIEENGLIGERLCVACSNKYVTASAKIKVT